MFSSSNIGHEIIFIFCLCFGISQVDFNSPLEVFFSLLCYCFLQVCMDILGFIIQCTQPPLSEPLLNSVFPVVVNTILASDDNSVLQVELALVLIS